MTHPISFVSLGPGEPELITVKGLKQLQQADIIYCPATRNKQGTSLSRAADIVRALEIDETAIHCFMLPMSKDRTEAWKVYDALYNEAADGYRNGQRIVIVAEGDAGFYSSIQYIYDKFTKGRYCRTTYRRNTSLYSSRRIGRITYCQTGRGNCRDPRHTFCR